jgi:hypothetical protein
MLPVYLRDCYHGTNAFLPWFLRCASPQQLHLVATASTKDTIENPRTSPMASDVEMTIRFAKTLFCASYSCGGRGREEGNAWIQHAVSSWAARSSSATAVDWGSETCALK